MNLSVWLRVLAGILGIARAKQERVAELERAAAAVEVVKAALSESEKTNSRNK